MADGAEDGPYYVRSAAVRYRFHDGSDIQVCQLGEEMAVIVDQADGLLLKHGASEYVRAYLEQLEAAFRSVGAVHGLALDLQLICLSATPDVLEELNACIQTTGRIRSFTERLSRSSGDMHV